MRYIPNNEIWVELNFGDVKEILSAMHREGLSLPEAVTVTVNEHGIVPGRGLNLEDFENFRDGANNTIIAEFFRKDR